MMKKVLALFIVGWAWQSVIAQNTENSLLENLTEIILSSSEEEPDIEELTEAWQFFLENPININSDCGKELRQLRFLSEFQIQEIEDFKIDNGPLLSIYELAVIEGLNRELLENLEPFIFFGKSDESVKYQQRVKSELYFRSQRIAEKAKGYLNEDSYSGSPEKYYLRFKQTGNKVNFGFTAEKDPGETFFRKPNKQGFDYYSAFANYEINKGKYRIYAGDFITRAGQGLVIWQGFASGKSAEVSQVFRTNQGIRSYSSADENRFLRGLAGEVNFRNTSLYVFHSMKKIDANLDEVNGQMVFTSFQTSGLHRTSGEIADKHSLTENVSGLQLEFRKKNFSLGAVAVHTIFDKPKVSNGQIYQLFLFDGKEITNTGINYKWSLKNIFLFGETAYVMNGGFANLHGAMLKPNDRLELSLLYRNFNKEYNSLYGQAFAESGAINDERGFYLGAKFLPAPKVSISTYHDFFSYRWLKYQTASPSSGYETFLQVNYSPNSEAKFYVRYFMEQKDVKSSEDQMKINISQTLQKARFNLDFELNEQWSIRSRAEFSVFSNATKEYGLLLMQDMKYKSAKLPFTWQLRFAWFDTDSYNCRIYAYENDLLYNFSIPALSGKGIRTYLNGKFSLTHKFDIWLKLARTQYFEQLSVGSGLDEIEGDRKTELKIQFRYRF